MYSTVSNDLSWNADILDEFRIETSRLPLLIPADHGTGRLRKNLAAELGLKKEPPVLIGGNDAVLAAFSVGIREPGEIFSTNGTCEITMV
jgi:sugar (pentulose or hexulose) kinase